MRPLRMLTCCALITFCATTLIACGDEPLSQDAVAEDLASVYAAQADERTVLVSSATKAWQAVSESTVGDPAQLAEARAALEDLIDEVKAKQIVANAPVIAAEEALSTAKETAASFEGRAHYAGRGPWCGGDGCGGSCSDDCSFERLCYDDYCRCIPSCGDKECGSDGCGGICGSHKGACPGKQYCNDDHKCVDPTYRTDSCQPSCSQGGSPARAEREVMNPQRSNSVPRNQQKENRPDFTVYDDLANYLSELNGRADDLQARQAGHKARAAEIEALKGDIVSKDAAMKSAKANATALALAARGGEPETGSETSKAQVDGAKEAATAATKAHRDASTALRALEAKHRSEAGLMTRYAEAEARMRTEARRLSAIASAWKAGLDGITTAEVALEAAKVAAQPAFDALETEYKAKVEAATKTLEDLQKPAFGEALQALWQCSGPACPTDGALIRPDTTLDLDQAAKALAAIHESRRAGLAKHTAALAAQKKAESAENAAAEGDGEAEAKEEKAEAEETRRLMAYPEWKNEVAALEAAAIYVDELCLANERTIGLRNALHKARSVLGE